MSEIIFKGKEFVYNHHLSVPFSPLVIDEHKGVGEPNLDGNLIIHGDNLNALKSILPHYAGKIDCIYIDPPYNTGREEWCFNDNVNAPMIKEWFNRVPVGEDDALRHEKWCCIMWPRLKLLNELLSDTGAIFVSIDDNEVHRLRSMMDEIFGGDNFRNIITVRRGVKNLQAQFSDIDKLATGQEYILFYSKYPETRFPKLYKHRDSFRSGGWNNHWRGTDRPTMRYELFGQTPSTGQWRWSRKRSLLAIKNYDQLCKEIGSNPDQCEIDKWYVQKLPKKFDLIRLSKTGKPEHYVPPSDKQLLNSLWVDMTVNEPASTFDHLEIQFSNPKRIELIKRIVDFVTPKDGIVLDSFAGSGTTAHAVFSLNKLDGGNRRFVLVECEDYANTTTAERVRKIIHGYNSTSIQKTELMRQKITWRTLNNASQLIDQVKSIEKFHNDKYDRVTKKIDTGELIVTGETDINLKTEGFPDSFTFCTLGESINIDKMLSGQNLPSFEAIGTTLFHIATNQVLKKWGGRRFLYRHYRDPACMATI